MSAPGPSELRTFHHSEFPLERLREEREHSVSVCLPARDEEATIGTILRAIVPLCEVGLVDQLAVVDDSSDSTWEVAAASGAEVYDQSSLVAELGPVRGKGDAMWRALSVLRGDVVCFVDADSECFGPHFVCGLIGPALCGPRASFVKGFYRRPFRTSGEEPHPEGGGRVTELTARPLLKRFYPELAGLDQPLAGEIAARRDLLERLPFTTGYGVDVGLVIDAWRAVGLDGIAQVDLDVRQNRHRPLRELGAMACAVLDAVTVRLEREGRLVPGGDQPPARGGPRAAERPPMASLALSGRPWPTPRSAGAPAG